MNQGRARSVFVLVCLALVVMPVQAALRVEPVDGGGFALRVDDEAPFHVTSNTVSAQRLLRIRGADDRVALWTETTHDGAVLPYYAIGLAGAALGEGMPTSYRLKLRHGEFDPLAGTASVEPGLAATPGENLYLVQFETQPLQSYRDAIGSLGGAVRGYIPGHAHIVEMAPHVPSRVEALEFVRWVGPYQPAYRLEEALRAPVEQLRRRFPRQRYSILVFATGEEHLRTLTKRLDALGPHVAAAEAGKHLLNATLTPEQLLGVVRWDEVAFIDRFSPLERDMDIVREQGGANYLESVAGYTGVGVRGESFDTGFNVNHPDFASRPPIQHGGAVGNDSHGTACLGICFGDGTGDPQARGLMPDGQPICADYNNIGLTGTTRYDHTGELLQAPYNAVFQTASVGSARTTQYTTISADHDTLLFDWQVLHCQSQSNAGTQNSRPQAWAKNVVSGGAFNHYDTPDTGDDCWCGTASIGPASDGRIKPDLSFFYDDTYTTYTTGSGYGQFGGTSGATPSICGHFGLFFQMWSDGIFGNEVDPLGTVFDNRPKMTTAKAFMINTAEQYAFSGQSHDMTRVHQGWGVPSVRNLYDLRDDISFIDESVLLSNTESVEFNAFVDPGTPAMRVTMTYADPAGNPAASQHRINDLSLRVTSPSGTVYHGNVGLLDGNWSQPSGAPNDYDTVENVFVENPEDGLWILRVTAADLVQDGHVETPELDADFALVVSGAFMTQCTSDGTVSLDAAGYACEDSAAIRVVDCDLNTDDNTVQTVTVTVDSTSEPGGETVLLTETDAASATFTGAIPVSETDAAGTLLVAEGDTVTATYVDADDGMGGTNVTKTDQATVDCTPPVISNVQTQDVEARSATVTFVTDEPARGTVRYGPSCGNLGLSASKSGYVTSHSIVLGSLSDNTTYFYAVDAEDQVGNSSTDDNGGACYSFTTPMIPDFFTEQFNSDNDTDFLRFSFTPDGSSDFYSGCTETIASLPTDPAGGTPISLSDDSSQSITLSGGATVSLYGVSYPSFFVGSNGFITFTAGDSDTSETLADHFDLPRISALFDDLNPAAGGTVSWKQLADRAVVTFDAVPEYSTSNSNTFQIELFFNGTITINYLDVAAIDGLAGLSEGNGVSPDFFETDLSAQPACGGETCFDGTLNNGEQRIDCGGPNCPACACLTDPECEDQQFCNGTETCNGFGQCVSSGDPCSGGFVCDEQFDTCLGCDDDGVCERGEDCLNCPNDCISDVNPVCGDGVCEGASGENCLSCPSDCNGVQNGKPTNRYCCGDGLVGENPVSCADARCNAGGKTCEADPVLTYCCGDGFCEGGETLGNCTPDCTPPVPAEAGATQMMMVTGYDEVAGTLTLSFGVPCSATGHVIEYGPLTHADLASYNWTGQECGVDASGVHVWNLAGTPDSMFFVVVGNNGADEGSYGLDSNGLERGEDWWSSTCPYVQNLPYACQ
jgi:hypothetical protein